VKLNSISGVSCFVKDLDETAEFYEGLGFRIGKREPDRLTCYVNWFWMTFVAEDRGEQNTHIKVDDLDECYQEVVAQGHTPDGEPRKSPGGGREFTLRDPDGYKLVFFAKK
jgi:catechol 2,3-dioxygenase-like lactoylglutathione lyase family enzyme